MIELDGHRMGLSRGLFVAWCNLVDAKISTPLGMLQLSRRTVQRLREKIEEATGDSEVGHEIIRPGLKHEYFLAIAVNEIAYRKSFRDLVAAKRIDPTIGENILRACREV